MLCCSPSNMDPMDNFFSHDSPNSSEGLESLSKDALIAFIREHMPALPATSSQCVSNFIQSSDVMEEMSYIDHLPAYLPDGLISGFCADDLLDPNFICSDTTGYSSASTTPSISPNYESHEVVSEGKNLVYWNGSMPASVVSSCQSSLQHSADISEADKCMDFETLDQSDDNIDSFLNKTVRHGADISEADKFTSFHTPDQSDNIDSFLNNTTVQHSADISEANKFMNLDTPYQSDNIDSFLNTTVQHSTDISEANKFMSFATPDQSDNIDSFLNTPVQHSADISETDKFLNFVTPDQSDNIDSFLNNTPVQHSADISEADKFINFNTSDQSDNVDCFLNIDSIKKEPVDNELIISGSRCLVCNGGDCDCYNHVTEMMKADNLSFDNLLSIEHSEETNVADCSENLCESFLIHPSGGDVLLGFPDEPYQNELNIPSSSSEGVGFYSVKDQLNSSFGSSEECKVVKTSEVFPSFHRDQEVRRPIRSVLSSHNFGSRKIKSEPHDSESFETDLPEPDKDEYIPYLSNRLTPIEMVKKDHCYYKQLNDQPEAPVPAPSPLWNAYLGDMNNVEVPVKRRPGRPRKSTTSVPAERHTRVTVPKPPQKRTRKPSQVTSKRVKLNNGSSVRNDKREQHNRAERERRFALRSSMISVAGQCPEHVLHLTNIALTATKHERSEEEIENNFTVEVVRRVDELVKRGDYDIKKLRTKKSQNFSKMIMLLSITYTIVSLDKELKVKETMLRYQESLLRQATNRRRRQGY